MGKSQHRVAFLRGLQRIGARPPEIIELFDYMENTPLWLKNSEGRYQWVNRPFLLFFGLSDREEIIGRTDYDFSGDVLANQYRIDDEKVLKGERIISRIELVGRYHHNVKWCATSKIPLHDAKGRIVGTAGITRPLADQPRNVPSEEPLSGALFFISEHYNERIANQTLARLSKMSLRGFERHFKATYGCSPHTYLRQLRVRMSCSNLVYTKKSLTEIAHDYGFADQSHFNKEFRKIMDEAPGTYRARHQH